MLLTLTYRDEENDCIHVSSSVELEHAIQQLSKNNLSTMTFEGVAKAPWSMANNTATHRAADEADNNRTVEFSRLGSSKCYEYACKVFHKLSKSKSLSSAQNYQILTIVEI